MLLGKWVWWWRALASARRNRCAAGARRRRARLPRATPRIESLEDRTVPVLFVTADLQRVSIAATAPVIAGNPESFVATVRNNGTTPVFGLNLTEQFSPGFAPAHFTPSAGTYYPSTGSWTGLTLAPGATATLTAAGTLSGSATGMLTATASLPPATGLYDPLPGNNTFTAAVALLNVADLAVTQTDNSTPPGSASAGGTVTYTVVVSNNGPSKVTGAAVTDNLPPAILSASWSAVPSGEASVAAPSGTGSINTTVNLAPGASVTFTLTATINPTATGTVTNTATVAAPTGSIDPNTVNNSATDTLTLSGNAISLSQSTVSITPSAVASGGTATVTLTARDSNGAQATGGGLTVVFGLAGGTSIGTFSAVTDNGDGTYTAILTGTTAGTASTVTATIFGNAVTSALPTLTVLPVSLAQSTVSVSPSSVASGSAATVTLTAIDADGTPETGGGLTVAFGLGSGSTSGGSFGAVTDNGDGTYSATFTGTTAGTPTTITATINGSAVTSTLPTVTVTPGPVNLAQSTVSVTPGSIASGDTATVTLTARDAAGNRETSGGLTVLFGLGSGGSAGSFGAVTDNGDGTYTATFTGTATTITATIDGGAVTSTLPSITVTPGPVSLAQSTVSVSPSSVATGGAATVTLTARDAAGNRETSGGLTVTFGLAGDGDSSGSFGAVTDNGDGTYTATFTGTTAGTPTTLTATIGGDLVTSPLPTITVT
jgi:adhesin/invasin